MFFFPVVKACGKIEQLTHSFKLRSWYSRMLCWICKLCVCLRTPLSKCRCPVCVCVCFPGVSGPEPSHFSLSASWLSRHALCHIQPKALCLSLSSHSLSLSSSFPCSLTPILLPLPLMFVSIQGAPGPRGPPGEIGRDGPKVCVLNVFNLLLC